MTYLSQFYHVFAKGNNAQGGSGGIANITDEQADPNKNAAMFVFPPPLTSFALLDLSGPRLFF